MRSGQHEGFTLFEVLLVVAIIGIAAAMAIPLLSSQDSKKLEVAAQETGNALRFAVSEARRTGSYILVDAKTVPGRLKVVTSDDTGADRNNDPDPVKYPPTNDPLTKRALDIDTAGSAFSGPVTMTARFMGGGMPYTQLLISPTTLPLLQAFNGSGANMGLLEPNSGIVLALGASSVTVTINELTGFVAIP